MTEQNRQKSQNKFYYGWIVFGVCFLMIMITLGFGSSQKGTYLKAVTEQLGLERGRFAVGDALRFIVTAVLNFFFGALVKRLKARKMVALGFLALIAYALVNATATTYWQFYLGGALLGTGLAWTTTTVVGYITENWFTNNKGTMMGIILAANGLGGFLSEPVITKIIYGADGSLSEMDSRWRLAYFVTAGLLAVTAAVVVLLIRDRPEDKGLEPLGQDIKKQKKRGMSWSGYEMKEVLKKPYFYISGLCVFAIGFVLQSMTSTAKPHMYDIGLTKDFVIRVFMLHSLTLMVAKMAFGAMFDRFGIRISFGLCTLAATVALLSVSLITPERGYLAYVYSIISSFGLPLETVMIPLLVSQLFGRRAFSHIMGYYLALNCLGYAVGVVTTNLAFDAMGTYRPMLIVLTAIMIGAGLVSQFSILLADRDRIRVLKKK